MSWRSRARAIEAETAGFWSPLAVAESEVREKGSRFLARLTSVADEDAAVAALRDIESRDRDATHHCWARRVGWPPRERGSDAGEPAGTAGMPILHALRGAEVSDALLVVTRWYGGTKLGKGGLARAYALASRRVIAGASFTRRVPTVRYRFSLPYQRLGSVKRLLGAPGVNVVRQEFLELVEIELTVDAAYAATFEAAAADLGPLVVLERIHKAPEP